MLKRGDRVATVEGVRGIVEKDYDPILDGNEVLIYWGTSDNQSQISWVWKGNLFLNPSAEFPHDIHKHPIGEPRAGQQVPRLEAEGHGDVDVIPPDEGDALPSP